MVTPSQPRDAAGLPREKETAATAILPQDEIDRIVQSRHDAPHTILGPHPFGDGKRMIVRAFLPHAEAVTLRVNDIEPDDYAMCRLHPDGLFEAVVEHAGAGIDYVFIGSDRQGNRFTRRDPYCFTESRFTPADLALFVQGRHRRLYEKLGAHPVTYGQVHGVNFAVWAPQAQRVSVVGTFNQWDGRCHQMRRLNRSGIWEIFVPEAGEGDLYKYEIKTAAGSVFLKGDPFAFRTEAHPATASVVYDADWGFCALDAGWLQGGRQRAFSERGIFARAVDLDAQAAAAAEAGVSTFRALARPAFLAAIKAEGYTHIELTSARPGHWGSASSFAPGSADGTPEELMELIDACHAQGIGVLVPAFTAALPASLSELAWFDGSPLYETATAATATGASFDRAKPEVTSFLLSQAAFWVDRYHVDGWRTDATMAHLYRGLVRDEAAGFAGIRIAVALPARPPTVAGAEMDRLVGGRHDNPFAILGPHFSEATRELTVRAFVPHAQAITLELAAEPELVFALSRVHPQGLFEAVIPDPGPDRGYRLFVRESGEHAYRYADAYSYAAPVFAELDQHLFGEGNHYRICEKLGAHVRSERGVEGVNFAVWAPNALGVSVVGPFNRWDGRYHPMQRHGVSGVWELFVPEIGAGALYKFEIRARNGHTYLKADPYAFFTEAAPGTASIVSRLEGVHAWQDQDWMDRRARSRPWEEPIAVYEVHLGSWQRREDGSHPSYREIAAPLVSYVKRMGFTHIELLPIAEHPFEPSWGYQVTNYYAPCSRFGPPQDLMALVDACHQAGIGVILDWVPAHFPRDAFALAWFDGSHLYEHADPRQGEHRDWGTLIFNYGRHEVENFLIGNALFWLEHYHFDGLRVDAVASMLYLDYSRPKPGDWIPNQYGGRENLEAIEFIKHTNAVVHQQYPGVMMIAEESTSFPAVSRPTDQGGLGFGFKWNMGWMHDVLAYMKTPPTERRNHHSKLTFGLVYAFSENFVLSLSHDEVVHLKGSLLTKMAGTEAEKLANLRLLFAFMYAHPGKKLLFMGAEFGQRSEWNHARSLEWDCLNHAEHRGLVRMMEDLNALYRRERAFFEVDFKGTGFEWLDADSADACTLAFLRKAKDPRNALMFVFNFSGISLPHHRVGVPYPVAYTALFSTNAQAYGGHAAAMPKEGVRAEEVPWHGRDYSIEVPLAAFSALILKPAAADNRPVAE